MSRFYDTAVWHKARRIQLAHVPLCEMCSASGLTVIATDVDHIVPISQGGAALDPENFRSLCRPCHSRVTWRQLNKTDKPMKGCSADGLPTDPEHPWHGGK
jgi:5-methylcytosine-specific restriction protein A